VTLCDNSKGLTQNNLSKKQQRTSPDAIFWVLYGSLPVRVLKTSNSHYETDFGIFCVEGAENSKISFWEIGVSQIFFDELKLVV
jgi:hypothetical protein